MYSSSTQAWSLLLYSYLITNRETVQSYGKDTARI